MLTKTEITEATGQLIYMMQEGVAKEYGFTEAELNSWLDVLKSSSPELVGHFCSSAQRSGFVTTNIIKSLLSVELNKVTTEEKTNKIFN